MTDPYTIRREAERVVAEDRVPTDVLVQLIRDYGEPRGSSVRYAAWDVTENDANDLAREQAGARRRR